MERDVPVEHARERQIALWGVCIGVFVAGTAVALLAARTTEATVDRPFHAPFWVLALAFVLAERYSVHLEARKHAHTLTFAELPLTLGLIFADTSELIISRIVVAGAAIVIFRNVTPQKFLFNAGNFGLDVGAALLIYHAILGSAVPVEPIGWVAAFAAVATGHLLGAGLVMAVMRLAGAFKGIRSQLVVVAVAFTTAMTATAVGLSAAAVLWYDSRAWVLLLLIGAGLGYFFNAYVRIRERHQALSTLHGYATSLVPSRDPEQLAEAITRGLAELLSAEAVTLLAPGSDEFVRFDFADGNFDISHNRSSEELSWLSSYGDAAPAGRSGWVGRFARGKLDVLRAPLPLPGGEGVVIVRGRESSVRAFDDEDVQLLETAAGHAASALHNAQLVERLRSEAEFRAHQALHDDITDLPNARALVERLKDDLALGTRLIVLTLRVHSLREVNETLGRAVGDEMLRRVSERLLAMDEQSWCARSGTDEFTVVVPGGQDGADGVANRIVEAFDQPVLCGEVSLAVTVGIGVTLAPQHGTEAEILVRRASLAASRSAIEGTTVTTWAADRDPYDPQRLTIAADLRDAIPRGELEVHFQPQVDMKTGDIVGAEALVRWAHPRLGQLRPDQFIAAAEHTGAIDSLTFHVLTVATETGRRWHDRGWNMEMAVNLSARNLTSPRFAARVSEILERTGFPAELLTLELTESSVMTEASRALATLDELSELGVTISIDDFGTGYSSLAHLRRLPVNEIKIDKSFVFDLTTNESDEAIVRSMVDLGHTLSLRVVVEGVETVEVRDRLEKIGSDRLQGYLVSRPLTAPAFETWMHERRVRATPDTSGRVVHLQPRR